MKKIAEAWSSLSLIKRIIIGLVIGALLGAFGPKDLAVIEMLGTLFVSALKAVAPFLVFFLVINALCHTKLPKSMKTIVVLYVVSTLAAAFTAVAISFAFPVELTLSGVEAADKAAPTEIAEVLTTLIGNMVVNPVDALLNANYIGILVWAVLLGIAMRYTTEPTKDFFANMSHVISIVVRWIITCAPFGIMGLIYTSVSQNGPEIFIEYGQLLLVLLGAMFFICLVVNPLLVFINIRKNPYPIVFRCIKDSGMYAFFTRSSAANIPVNMELCKRLGIRKDTYSVSIPLGATINMAGAGYVFENKIVGGVVPKEYIPAIDKGIQEALNSGVLAGYPVEDIKVELIDGSYHDVDSSEAAFKVAGSMAIKDALKKSDPVILEPVMAVEVETPEEYTGFVMGDIPSRRGLIQGQEQRGNAVCISAKVPLSQMFGYATDLRSGTQGRATYTMQFDTYEPVPKNVAEEIISKAGGNA